MHNINLNEFIEKLYLIPNFNMNGFIIINMNIVKNGNTYELITEYLIVEYSNIEKFIESQDKELIIFDNLNVKITLTNYYIHDNKLIFIFNIRII